jgi:hypothetical protein
MDVTCGVIGQDCAASIASQPTPVPREFRANSCARYVPCRDQTGWLCAQFYANWSRPACPLFFPVICFFSGIKTYSCAVRRLHTWGPGGATAGDGRKMNNEPPEREPIDRMRARLEALLKANAAPRCGARSKRTGKPCRGERRSLRRSLPKVFSIDARAVAQRDLGVSCDPGDIEKEHDAASGTVYRTP